MKKRKNKQFKYTLFGVAGAGLAFLGWVALFGKTLAAQHFQVIAALVFAVMAIAAFSFLIFSFFPYFRGDTRWYTIPALLTVVFFAGTGMLWQVSLSGGF